jgi:hypothetical protein
MSQFRALLFFMQLPGASQGPGKKWEHYELNKNGNPLKIAMHVRKGDTVQVIAGKDKGKVGEVSLVRAFLPCLSTYLMHACKQDILAHIAV